MLIIYLYVAILTRQLEFIFQDNTHNTLLFFILILPDLLFLKNNKSDSHSSDNTRNEENKDIF